MIKEVVEENKGCAEKKGAALKKEEKKGTINLPEAKTVEEKKTPAWGLLLEKENKEDKEWLERQTYYNDKAVDDGTVLYPNFQLASGKSVGVLYRFKDGECFVRFKKVEGEKICIIDLNMHQWGELLMIKNQLLEFIHAVEGRIEKKVHKVFGLQEDDKRITKLSKGWMQHQFELLDNVRVTAKWHLKLKNCTIDIRRYVQCFDDEPPVLSKWIATQSGICLAARSFDYFARFLPVKVRNGLRMWGNMHQPGSLLWGSLFSSYQPAKETVAGKKANAWAPLASVEDDEAELNNE